MPSASSRSTEAPGRPWRADELERALDLAEVVAEVGNPVPPALGLAPLASELPTLVTGWASVEESWPHRDEAAALAAAYARLPDRAFCHSDLRDDNVLLCADGTALACDWNWPALAPAWQDTVDLLVSAYGDGLDADVLLARRALTRDVDPEHVDAWLAALCGFMLDSAQRPVPASSPYLRVHGRWYAEATWQWLSERRGWT